MSVKDIYFYPSYAVFIGNLTIMKARKRNKLHKDWKHKVTLSLFPSDMDLPQKAL